MTKHPYSKAATSRPPSRLAALRRPSTHDEEIALEDLAGAVTPRGQAPATLPRLLELVLAPDLEPYVLKPEIARAVALGVPALAEAAQEWAGGSGDGESLSQLLAERAVERDAPGLARLSQEVAFLTLATARERSASSFSRTVVSGISEACERLDTISVDPLMLERLRRLVLCWQAWAGGAGGLHAAFVDAHRIVRDLAAGLGPEPQAESESRDEAPSPVPETRGEPAVTPVDPRLTRVVLPALPLAGSREARQALDAFEAIEALPLPLVPVPDLAAVRARLLRQLPHWESVIDAVLRQVGTRPHTQLRLLLVGPPGVAKTYGAGLILEALGIPHRVIDCGSLSDAMVMGSSRKWSNGAPSLLWDVILAHRTASPGLILDEIEKTGGSDRNGDIKRSLLGLLEPQRAAALLDSYLEVPVDFSGVSVILTANTLKGLSRPLLDRLQVITVPQPGLEHLEPLAFSLLRTLYRERTGDERWVEPLTGGEIDLLRRYWNSGSIRALRRLVEQVASVREGCATRH
jgi:ATP-dependent Lon protease